MQMTDTGSDQNPSFILQILSKCVFHDEITSDGIETAHDIIEQINITVLVHALGKANLGLL